MLFKDFPEDELQSYVNAVNKIQPATNRHNSALFDSLQIQEYATALSDMEPKQAALLLSTTMSKEQAVAKTKEIMASMGLAIAEEGEEMQNEALSGKIEPYQEWSNRSFVIHLMTRGEQECPSYLRVS